MFPDLILNERPASPTPPARPAATLALFSPSEHAERRFLEFFTAPPTSGTRTRASHTSRPCARRRPGPPFQTPELGPGTQARSQGRVDSSPFHTNVVGLCDRAFLGVLVHSVARLRTAISFSPSDPMVVAHPIPEHASVLGSASATNGMAALRMPSDRLGVGSMQATKHSAAP